MIATAELVYGASALLITISLVLLNYAWKQLKEMLSSLPEGERRVRFFGYIRSIQDEGEKDKALLILSHFIGCMLIASTIALSVFAILGVSSVMLGYKLGFYQQENYEFGKVCLFIGVGCFATGIFFTSLTYISKVISVITGRPDILTTDSSAIPPLSPNLIAQRRLFARIYFPVFFAVLFPLLLFDVFNTWIDILITLGSLIAVYFGHKLISRRKKKQ